ncbi:MAG: hypothetical protein LCH41_05525 [Armatimonadetes bacterium]|nr:hypothetical protein [Armatimonadota bacterium]
MSQPESFPSSPTQPEGHVDSTRKKSIKLGIATSLVSKLFGAIVQFGAMPLAAAKMAEGHYDVYTFLLYQAMLLGLLNLGSGPGVVPEMSRYATEPNQQEEASWFTSSFWVGVISSVALALVILIAAPFVPIQAYVGKEFWPFEQELRLGLVAFAGIQIMRSVINQVTYAYMAYMEEYRMKAVISIGYGISIPAILAVAFFAPHPVWLLIAVIAVPFLAQYATVYRFWKVERPYLVPRLALYNRARGWKLFLANAYSSLAAAGTTVTMTVPLLLFTRVASQTEEVGYLGTLLTWYALASTVVVMIASAVMPTISNAFAHRDFSWIRRASLKAFRGTGLYGLILIIGCGAALPFVTQLLYPTIPEYHGTHFDGFLLGALIATAGFNILLKGYLEGIGRFGQSAVAGFAGAAVALILTIAFMPAYGGTAVFCAIIASQVVAGGVCLAMLYQDVFRPAFGPAGYAPAPPAESAPAENSENAE